MALGHRGFKVFSFFWGLNGLSPKPPPGAKVQQSLALLHQAEAGGKSMLQESCTRRSKRGTHTRAHAHTNTFLTCTLHSCHGLLSCKLFFKALNLKPKP